MFRERKAQSTLEYILVLSAIIGLIIYAAVTWIKPAVNTSLDDAKTTISNAASKVEAITP